MRLLLSCALLACAGAASAQADMPDPLPFPQADLDLLQGGPAWLVGDHVKARQHFSAAVQRSHPLGQYNLAMMLLHREGGPCDPAQAVTLLRKAADAGVALAREALDQLHDHAAAPEGPQRGFPCARPLQARSTPAVGPIRPEKAVRY
jgi:TPR repeat protein